MVVGQRAGDVRQQPRPVQRLDLDRDQEHRVLGRATSSTSTRRSCCALSCATLAQLVRCTDTPCPRVTKPTISSPGTGVQQRDSLTQTSGSPGDHHARGRAPPGPARLRIRVGTEVSARSSSAPSTPPSDCDELLHDRLGGDVALAHRRVQRGDVRVAQVAGEGEQGLAGHQPLQRQALLAHRPADRLLARLDRGLAALLGEPLRGSCCGPGRLLTNFSQSRDGPASGDLEVKISTVSPLSSVRLQRHQPAVDPRADAPVADLGVHRVGEVDRGRALRAARSRRPWA